MLLDTTMLLKISFRIKTKAVNYQKHILKAKLTPKNNLVSKKLAVHKLQINCNFSIWYIYIHLTKTIKLFLGWDGLYSFQCLVGLLVTTRNQPISESTQQPIFEQVNFSKLNPLIKEPLEAIRVMKNLFNSET